MLRRTNTSPTICCVFCRACEYLLSKSGLVSIHLLWGSCKSPGRPFSIWHSKCHCPLPLHMVQVSQHTQASDGVELAIVDQAAVSAAGHRHPWDQVPVVQQGHVAPDVSHHHPRICAPWDRKGSGFSENWKLIFTCFSFLKNKQQLVQTLSAGPPY